MSRQCELTGVGVFTGNNVSHSNRKTRRRWLPNLKAKKYFVPELGQTLSLKLSTRAIRTIDKHGGLSRALFQVKEDGLSAQLAKAKRLILKQRRAASAPKVTQAS
jgi:large subunit ribosomal protein L28